MLDPFFFIFFQAVPVPGLRFLRLPRRAPPPPRGGQQGPGGAGKVPGAAGGDKGRKLSGVQVKEGGGGGGASFRLNSTSLSNRSSVSAFENRVQIRPFWGISAAAKSDSPHTHKKNPHVIESN